MQSWLECLWEQQNGDSKFEFNIIVLSYCKIMKKWNKKILDNWIIIQEMLVYGVCLVDGKWVYNFFFLVIIV